MAAKIVFTRGEGRISIILCAVAILAMLLGPATACGAGPFSVQDELTVPSAPNARFSNQWSTPQPGSGQREMFSSPHAFHRTIDTGMAIVPLDFLDLPAEFGLVVDQSGDQAVYQGLTYIMSDSTRLDASWGFGRTYQSLEGYLDLHFGF